MNRRQFLEQSLGITSTVFLTDIAKTSPAVETSRTDHKEADVCVFFDQCFVGRFSRPKTPRQIRIALNYAVQSIPAADETFTVDVSFPDYRVGWQAVDSLGPHHDWDRERLDPDILFSEWQRLLDEDVPTDAVAADSNILITAHTLDGFTGKGLVPGACSHVDVADASIVEMPHQGFDAPAVTAPRNPDWAESTLSTIVHEFGHTVGLTHDMGRAEIRDDGAYVSPMISRYARDETFMGRMNHYGEQLPESVSGQFLVLPRFNPDIPLSDVYTAASC